MEAPQRIVLPPLEIPAVSTVERLQTEQSIISNGVFITFKILREISVRLSEKMLPK
jgi:hypothetical protein